MPRNSPFATEFDAATEKRGIARFFAAFISNSRFFRFLFNFTIYKTKSTVVILSYGSVLSPLCQSLTQCCVLIALFFNNIIFFDIMTIFSSLVS